VDAPHRRGVVGPPLVARHQIRQVGVQVGRIRGRRLPVDPGGPPPIQPLPGVAQELFRQVMGQGGEPRVRLRLRPLGDAFQFR
jgi:hypothetical protein